MRSFRTLLLATLAAVSLLVTALPAFAFPSTPTTPTLSVPASSTTTPTVDDVNVAQQQAIEIERQVQELNAEAVSISERLAVTSLRIYLQQRELDKAKMRLEQARLVYRDRVIVLYKNGLSPISLLLDSADLGEFITRVTWLARLAEIDHRAYEDAVIEAAEAEFQASQLEDLRAQDVELRALQEQRLQQSRQLLADQQLLVAQLDERAKAALDEARRLALAERKRWMDSSIPLTDKVAVEDATVDPYTGEVFKVAYYQPKAYKSTGQRFSAVCSWYGNEFHGRRTASGQVFNQEDLTCASRTLPFGTRIALRRGDRRIIVVVNDRGPFIAGRDLDLSRAAARLLGFSGVEAVEAEVVEPK